MSYTTLYYWSSMDTVGINATACKSGNHQTSPVLIRINLDSWNSMWDKSSIPADILNLPEALKKVKCFLPTLTSCNMKGNNFIPSTLKWKLSSLLSLQHVSLFTSASYFLTEAGRAGFEGNWEKGGECRIRLPWWMSARSHETFHIRKLFFLVVTSTAIPCQVRLFAPPLYAGCVLMPADI